MDTRAFASPKGFGPARGSSPYDAKYVLGAPDAAQRKGYALHRARGT
jgi:hypothetical protein